MEIKHGKLTVIGDMEMLPEGSVDRLIKAFDETYLKIWERFGDGEPIDITYSIESAYKGTRYAKVRNPRNCVKTRTCYRQKEG